jgi:aminoglycoside phosphotransferase
MLCEVFASIINGYYYVAPGLESDYFFKRVNNIIAMAYRYADAQQPFFDGKVEDQYAMALQSAAAQMCVQLINEVFDEEYFEHQLNVMSVEDESEAVLLKKYLSVLDDKKLKVFLQLIKEGNGVRHISYKKLRKLRRTLNIESCKLDASIPNMLDSYAAYEAFEKQNPLYFCDCLSKETIVDILLKHMDCELDIAVYTAKALFYSDCREAYNYLTLAFYFENYWGNNALHPTTLEEIGNLDVLDKLKK